MVACIGSGGVATDGPVLASRDAGLPPVHTGSGLSWRWAQWLVAVVLLFSALLGVTSTPAMAATFPCSVGPADIPTLHFTNAGNGTYQSIGLTVTAISATSGGCAALPSTTSIRPLYMGQVGAPGVPLNPATQQGGGLERLSAGEVAYKPPSPTFSGTDTFTVDNNNTSRVINVTVIVDGAALAPTVTSLAPAAGSTVGGTLVTIIGTGFTGATAVQFGGSSATSVTVNSATSITATAPAGSGTVDVTVTTPNGTSATSAGDQFTFVSAPTVSAVSPTSGPSTGGTTVTVTGTGFTGATAVQFGASSAASFTVNSATSITATAPAGSGTVNLTVTTAGGTSATSAGDQFLYVSAPTVTAVSPTSGPLAGGTTVTITGTNFAGATAVRFGASAATSFTVNSATSITATAPAGSGTVDITVTTTGGTSATGASDHYTYVAAPTVTAVSPTSGPSTGGTTVTVTGTGFTGATAVQFGASSAASFTVNSATSITATASAGSGTVDITVATIGGTSATSASDHYSYVAVPIANAVSATVAANSSANPITLNITGGAATSVAVASGAVHGTASASGTTISYTPTAGYSGADSFTYTATNASGTSTPATVTITVTAPTLVFSPAAGALAGATQGSAYSHTISASAGTAPYSYAVSAGALPAGITLSSSGVLSGTPTASGTFNFTVTATDSHGAAGSAAYSLAVAIAPPVANAVSAMVAANSSANPIPLSIAGGAATSVAVASGAAHGTATASGTTISYTPVGGYSGADSFTYTATNGSGTSTPATVTITVTAPTLVVAPASLPGAMQGGAYSQTITASAGTAPYSFAIGAGALPAGLTLSAAGTLSGTPIVSGTFNFTVTATDAHGATGFTAYTLVIGVASPVAGNVSATVAANSSANPITLNISGGAAASVAVASGAAHGTATASGTTISYTPTAGYSGSDSFTYTATNASGTSAPATVTITVIAPTLAFTPAAGALPSAMQNQAYSQTLTASGGTAPYSYAITAGALPAGLTLNPASGALAGTPTAAGNNSFTVTATDLHGATGSAGYTLAVSVQPPVAGAVSVSVPANSSANPITLNITGGAAASVAVASGAAHGTATASGTMISYTPTAGYSGPDSFTYTATNASGTSTPATVTVTVTPPAPTVHNPGTTTVTVGQGKTGSVGINLSNLVSGQYSAISISTPPSHGTVTLGSGSSSTPVIATYTPTLGYLGPDSFQFVASGPGGTSAPGTVAINVVGATPTAPSLTGSTTDGKTVSFDLTSAATEGPFTDADIVSITPTGAATATIIAGGTAAARTFRLDVTPKVRFSGTVRVAYRLANRFGFSAPATVTVKVTARPDPSADPVVRALSDAQAETTRRFSQTQVDNFMRRAETLHGTGGTRFDMGLRLASSDPSVLRPDPSRPDRGAVGSDAPPSVGSGRGPRGGLVAREPGTVAFWSGGAITLGTRDPTSSRAKFSASTSGVSGGADIEVLDGLTLGVGGGYGHDSTSIAADPQSVGVGSHPPTAHLSADTKLVAAYGSVSPVPGLFADAMVGHGWLSFDTRRDVSAMGGVALGSRAGQFTVGSLSLGLDRRSGRWTWSAYARGDYLDATLDAYAEHGADVYNLRFDRRDLRSLVGVLGARLGVVQPMRFGTIAARLRGEWQHEFYNGSAQGLDYADVAGPSFYAIRTQGWAREQFVLAPSISLGLPGDWRIDVEMGFRGAAGEREASSRLLISKSF